MASGHGKAPHPQGRTHGSTDQPYINLRKTLANREPSTHGTKQTNRQHPVNVSF